MLNQKTAAIDFYISLFPIGTTAWEMMTCWKLLQLFHCTMPLNENTRPLIGKHIGNQLDFSAVRDRCQPKASGALQLTASDEVSKAKASTKRRREFEKLPPIF